MVVFLLLFVPVYLTSEKSLLVEYVLSIAIAELLCLDFSVQGSLRAL